MDAATQRLLTTAPLLRGLRRDVRQRIVGAATVRDLPRRTPVWAAGDAFGGLGLVRSGVLREAVGSGDTELVLRFAVRGEWVGDATLLASGPHHTDLSAQDDAALVWVPAAALEPLDGTLARRLGALVAARCRRNELRAAEAAYGTVEARLAGVVLDLADGLGVRDSRGVIVNVRLTRRDLASLAGTTRESTSSVVGRWSATGVVETDAHRLVVLDRDRLRRLAGRGPEDGPAGPRRG